MTPWALAYGALTQAARSKTRLRHHHLGDLREPEGATVAELADRLSGARACPRRAMQRAVCTVMS